MNIIHLMDMHMDLYRLEVSEWALGWIPLSLGLVIKDKLMNFCPSIPSMKFFAMLRKVG